MSTSTNGILILPVVLLFMFESVFAQRQFPLGTLEFSVGPSLVSILDNNAQLEPVPKVSFAADIGFSYPTTAGLFFSNHLMYERKGGTRFQIQSGVESPEVRYNTSSSYLTYVSGFRKYLGNSNIFVEGGPFVAVLIASTTFLEANGAKTLLATHLAPIDFGVSGSIGCTPMRRQLRGLNFRLVNNLGLIDVSRRTGTKEITNALSFLVGMRLQTRHHPHR